ncbi:MAG: intradiol ring-cleavage dioxygenase [Alphaproteobacteria bacterium]|nr:intradiol ring-cleavage dioxygenase [Alphaproteobacteria bacterium]
MMQLPLSRRSLIVGSSALLARPALAAGRTPRQTEGPFYPVDWSGDIDSDLVRVQGVAADALGQVAQVMGRVLDARGNPVGDAIVEIWQCDAHGRYRHPGDVSLFGSARDQRFQGRGRAAVASDGSYRFRTIRPVAYSGRAPHIHFRVKRGGREVLTTQLYVAGDPLNERDGIYRREANRAALTAAFLPGEQGALAATFDIRLG